MTFEDTQIVTAIREDDAAALGKVMDTYSDMLIRTAYLMLNDYKLSEDMVQETFIKFYYNIDNFRCEASIKTYLSRILVNECRQRLRKNSIKKFFFTHETEEFNREIANPTEQAEVSMDISKALLKLDIKYREVVLLYYYNDLSIKEIASILKESEGTVKSKLKRARDKMRLILGEDDILND